MGLSGFWSIRTLPIGHLASFSLFPQNVLQDGRYVTLRYVENQTSKVSLCSKRTGSKKKVKFALEEKYTKTIKIYFNHLFIDI